MQNNKTHEDIIESASVTSLMRFLLSGDNEKVKNPDAYGRFFVNGKWMHYLNDVGNSKQEMQKKLPGCLYYHLIRTLKFDDSLTNWISIHKNSQVIILGAGFDSRAMRFADILDDNNISIFEVDLNAMLEHKQKVISKFKLRHNKNYFHAPCNFNDVNLSGCFENFKISPSIPTLILWEGVTYFLPGNIISATLRELHDYFSDDLQITLDYAYRDYIDGDLNFYGAKELSDVLVEINEPHFFGLNFNESNSFFETHGFLTVENLSAMMLESKYLRDNFGLSVGLPHVFNAMADIQAVREEL